MDYQRKTFHGVKWTSFSAVVNLCAKLGQVAVLTRFLSKEDFGLVAIALLFISFTEIFMDMGLSSAVLHKQNISKEEYSSLYWFNIFAGVIICLILCLCSPFIADFYNQKELIGIVSLLSLNIVFSSISRLQRTFQQKKMQFKVISIIEMTASVLMLIVSVILAINGLKVYSLVYSTLVYGFVIALFYLLYSIIIEKNLCFYFRMQEIISFLKIGIFQVGSSVLDYLSREMDILFISSAYSFEILGVYSVCKQLSLRIYGFVNPIVTKVLTPALASVQEDKTMLQNRYMQVIRILSLVNIPIYFCLIYASPYVLEVVYGESYVQYSVLFCILCLNFIFCSIGNPVGSLLVAMGKTNVGFYWTIYRIFSTLLFLYIGSMGGINIFVSSILLSNLFNIYPEVKLIYQKLINVNYSDYIESFIKPLLYAALLSPLLIFQFWISNPYVGAFVIGSIFLCLYVSLNLIYNKRDVVLLNSYLRLDRYHFFRLFMI